MQRDRRLEDLLRLLEVRDAPTEDDRLLLALTLLGHDLAMHSLEALGKEDSSVDLLARDPPITLLRTLEQRTELLERQVVGEHPVVHFGEPLTISKCLGQTVAVDRFAEDLLDLLSVRATQRSCASDHLIVDSELRQHVAMFRRASVVTLIDEDESEVILVELVEPVSQAHEVREDHRGLAVVFRLTAVDLPEGDISGLQLGLELLLELSARLVERLVDVNEKQDALSASLPVQVGQAGKQVGLAES